MNSIHDIPPKDAPSCAQPPTFNLGSDWLRLPKPGSRLEGLSRTTLTELVVPCDINGYKPPVRSILIKKRGAVRGIRLIERQSLYGYLQRLADEQARGMDGAAGEVSK